MSGKKRIVLAAVLLAAAAAAWLAVQYRMVDFRFYPRKAQMLDLRDKEISAEHYDKLCAEMPDCEILWNVPFQDTVYSSDTKLLTVTALTDEDVVRLDYLGSLEAVDASACTDYAQLTALRERRPEVQVSYCVAVGDKSYAQNAVKIYIESITQEQLQNLPYLTALKTVTVSGGENTENIGKLQQYCRENGIAFRLKIGDDIFADSETEITVSGAADAELNLLQFFPEMTALHLTEIEASAERVLGLPEAYPEVQVSWEQKIGGLTFRDTDTVVDLSTAVVTDLAEVEAKMAYLPNAETLIFGLCGIDNPKWGSSRTKNLAICEIENEALSAYRDRVREDYKVVWTVRLGPSIALRTDADNFMPNHFGVGQLPDSYAYNLRYCEDMVCLDVGHMTLTDISFVTFMPKLKYLILAWTEVQYIEPIRTCKNLVFLELDNSCIRDYSPLVDCTALEDLNIGNTFCDITPVLEMTWLKNLYMIYGNGGYAYKAAQALPNTRVIATGGATVGSGWRKLQNYYDMRDCLGAPYMHG